jgi:hypothetical protein
MGKTGGRLDVEATYPYCFLGVISYITRPEKCLCYFIQPGWTYFIQPGWTFIRVAVTHQHYQHYDQEYDFPESDPLFVPPRAIELIPETDPKHCRHRRGTRSVLLVQVKEAGTPPTASKCHDSPVRIRRIRLQWVRSTAPSLFRREGEGWSWTVL